MSVLVAFWAEVARFEYMGIIKNVKSWPTIIIRCIIPTFVFINQTMKLRFCVNLGGKYLLQNLTIYLIVNVLVNIIKL